MDSPLCQLESSEPTAQAVLRVVLGTPSALEVDCTATCVLENCKCENCVVWCGETQ